MKSLRVWMRSQEGLMKVIMSSEVTLGILKVTESPLRSQWDQMRSLEDLIRSPWGPMRLDEITKRSNKVSGGSNEVQWGISGAQTGPLEPHKLVC